MSLARILACIALGASVAHAQPAPQPIARDTAVTVAPVPSPSWYDRLGFGQRFTGDVVISGESYAATGIDARRPSGAWRLSSSPRLTLFGGMSVGVDLLLSNEQRSLRSSGQGISQVGLTPTWRWATLMAGDFTRDYSKYTTQGLRVRGGGFDLRPGLFHFGLQAGRTQRAVSTVEDGPVFARNMLAGVVGVGHVTGPSLEMVALHAKDIIGSAERDLLVRDTLFDDPTIADTLPDALRPRPNTTNRPQENFVLGLTGRLPLFGRRLTLRGEAAGAMLTRDLTAPRLHGDSVDRIAHAAASIVPLYLSSAGDIAYSGEMALNLTRGSLKAGYEYVGAGYSSLGLGYLINDRKAYSLGGSLRAVADHVFLLGQYQHQNDNLLHQRTATTSRDAGTATITARLTNALTLSFTGLANIMANDAPVDTFFVDMRSTALTGNLSVGQKVFGLQSSVSLAVGTQQTTDGNRVRGTPTVRVQNVSTAWQLALTPSVSVSPSVSGVLTSVVGQPSQRNVFAGFRGQGRMLHDRLRPSAQISHTFANGRQGFGVTTQLGYELPYASQLSLTSRYNSYSAFAGRPAFTESFITTSLSRSF